MDSSLLKSRLLECLTDEPKKTDFSIGHRGAPLRYPEHTRESYIAAAQQGAGILECDVTFTNDGTLVCRHSECDLHTTTDILLHDDLAQQCTKPFTPAGVGGDGEPVTASAQCCASDISIDQFRQLKGKMDGANESATTIEGYVAVETTAGRKGDLHDSTGTLLTHAESIELFTMLGAKFTPELKSATYQERVDAIFGSQEAYAQKMIDEYKDAGVSPGDVWAQSFNPDDVLYWIENEPAFGNQAVYLDGRYNDIAEHVDSPDKLVPTMQQIADKDMKIIAPPMWALLAVTDDGEIVPSPYALAAKRAGLDIIAWTFERSDLRNGSASGGWYWQFDNNPNGRAILSDSDMYKALDVLARDVGIIGIFSDWPATVTYYANCMGLD